MRRAVTGACLRWLPAIALLPAAVTCGPEAGDGRDGAIGHTAEPDEIGSNENPARVIPGATSLLAHDLSAADVGRTFGVDDAHVPYPDTYWAFDDNGIAVRWLVQAPSPLEKYMALTDPAHGPAAVLWETMNHGTGIRGEPWWSGHCAGWAEAATLVPPVLHPVHVRQVNGALAPCTDGEAGCIDLEIGDLDALAAEAFTGGAGQLVGARCDTPPNQIPRDAYGRIVRNGKGCKGLNPGALVIALAAQMRDLGKPLVIDAQDDRNTDQIWNQPAFRYTVNRYEVLDPASAANLVASGKRTGTLSQYPWNDAAHGFVLVDATIHWVTEYGPNLQYVSGLSHTHTTRFVAVLETDAPPSDPNARIIGGEYVDDPSVGADRLTNPPFVVIASGPGPEDVPPDADGTRHNPWVSPAVVMQLLQLGAAPAAR